MKTTIYSILDINGKIRLRGTISSRQKLKLSEIEAGIYLIQFKNGTVGRVVKW